MTTATRRWAALALALAAPAAFAQSNTLGDEFILFVDGTNVLIPNVNGGTTVNDPLVPTNKVVRFAPGAYAEDGFAWSRTEGIDASANVGATYGESDTLYFRILSDPSNAAQLGVSILLADATDDNADPRPVVEGDRARADYEFRLVWTIPAELHDGQWHNLAIPLPPSTYAALEEARAAGTLQDGAENWQYTGSWSKGGFGIGPGLGTTVDDPLWKDFDWTQLFQVGPFWDNEIGGGPIYLDDVYIGGPSTSTSAATAQPTAMSGVNFTPDGPVNTVSWSPVEGAGGYNVYASEEPITDVSAQGVALVKRVSFADPLTFTHRYESPHPSLGAPTIYYAVTTLSQFGVENTNVASSSGPITNASIAQKPYIRQITEAEADVLFDAVSTGAVSDAGYPADQPVFVFDSSHRTLTEGTTAPTDADASARIKIGYTDRQEWFVYGDVTDDIAKFASEGTPGGDTYMFDSIELGIGHYDVRTIEGASILTGSPHESMLRGDKPDYQIRITGRQNEAGDIVGQSTFVGLAVNKEVEGAATIVQRTDTGWKFLSIIPMDAIQAAGDVVLPVPGATELQVIPFTMSFNDADATGTRESQIVYSVKSNVTNQWYQTPTQWETVAIAGRDLKSTAVEDGALRDGFALAQSSPNPAGGPATVAFSLGEQRHVRLEVFNALGQRVAVVADGEFVAGTHRVGFDAGRLAAGVYVYRLSAGDYVATRRMTVVR